jgi:hypothetical protein
MKASSITRTSVVFLQAVVVLIGIAALAFLLWEPNVEGVNANATTFSQIYLDDPFLAYAYAVSILFFVALYQAFMVLGNAGRNALFSLESAQALRTIRYCGLALIASIMGAEAWLILAERGEDDIAGGVAMGLFMMVFFAVMTTVATVCERMVRRSLSRSSPPAPR